LLAWNLELFYQVYANNSPKSPSYGLVSNDPSSFDKHLENPREYHAHGAFDISAAGIPYFRMQCFGISGTIGPTDRALGWICGTN
jgi:hypothetical protein